MIDHQSENSYFKRVSVLFGIITTLLSYSFGNFDHIEQLPIIYRTLDSEYLINDFFVNSNANFSPRYYYAHLMALLSYLGGAPLAFFLGTLFSNISVSLLTYVTAKEIFGKERVGIIASALVMVLPMISLGSVVVLHATYFTPTTLVFPIILLSFYFFIKKKLLYAILCTGIVSIFHVLMGFEYGVLLLSTSIIIDILDKRSMIDILKKSSLFLIIFLFLSINLIPHFQNKTSIDSQLFIEIIANFRHPHHYVLSEILIPIEIIKLFFLSALGIMAFRSSKSIITSSIYLKKITIIGILLFIAAIAGWFFTEVVPSKLVTTLQTLRILNLFKWIVLLFIAHFISLIISKKKFGLKEILGLVCIVVLIIFSRISIIKITMVLSLYSFILGLIYINQKKLVYLVFISVGLFLIVAESSYFKDVNPYQRNYLGFYPLEPNKKEIVDYVSENSGKDAIFLNPADFGFMRTRAKRAIVIDFKAFPFSEIAMKEWYDRVQDCYGLDKNNLDTHYQNLDDENLSHLQKKYAFNYAILFTKTKTEFPVIFSNSEYKIIDLRKNAN